MNRYNANKNKTHTKAGSICAVYGCYNYGWQPNALSFFRFPKERERCTLWVNKCSRADLDGIFKKFGPEKLNGSYKICAKHFQPTDFCNPNLTSQGLKKHVTPSLFLPDSNHSVTCQMRKSPKKCKREEISTFNAEFCAKTEIHENQGEIVIKTEIEEDAAVSNLNSQNERIFFPNDSSEYHKDSEMDIKIEIKEEQWWQERGSAEAQSISDEIKVEMNDLISAESPRLFTEVFSSNNSTMVEEISFRFGNNSSECEETKAFTQEKEHLEQIDGIKMSDITSCMKLNNLCRQNNTNKNCSCKSDLVTCNLCDVCMTGSKINKLTQEGKNPFKCDICCKSFTRMGVLKRHKMIHEDTKPFKCDICCKSFTRMGVLKRHKMIHEVKKPFKCDICCKSFTRMGVLKRHKMIHEDKKPFNCDICCNRYTQLYKLKTHKLIHEVKMPYKCDFCCKSFSQSINLKKHKLIHEAKKPFRCDICYKGFNQSVHLKKHKYIHKDERSFKCDICCNSFRQSGDLKRHKFIHEDKKPFKCDICGNCFRWLGDLKRHKMIHEHKRPFKCDICCKSFTRSVNFKNHKLIHEGKMQFKCDICSKSFTLLKYLKNHKLIHESKKPFKCDICCKSFGQSVHLKKHKLIHEGETPIQV